MNHIDQIIAANEELVLAIEAYEQNTNIVGFGKISFALEEAVSDEGVQKKKTLIEKFKSFIGTIIKWVISLFSKSNKEVKNAQDIVREHEEKAKKEQHQKTKDVEELAKKIKPEVSKVEEKTISEVFAITSTV